MPWQHVMPKFKSGNLHSGSKKGPKVTNPKQAVAIMMSEKKSGIGPSEETANKIVKSSAKKKKPMFMKGQ